MIIMFTHIKTAANLNNLFHFSIYRLDFLPISFHVIIFFTIFVGRNLKLKKPMAKYTYKQENGEYVFYENDKPLKTPHEVPIKTDNEDLAKLLLSCLEHEVGYESPASSLTYHYTYCNLKKDYTQEYLADEFSNCVQAEVLMQDEYLMFRQHCPVKQPIAAFFEKELTENFHHYNLFQLSAVLVIHTAFDSWMLSQYIIADIIKPYCEDKDTDLDVLKEEFLDDLEEYECDEFGCDPEDDAYIRHREEMSHTIDAFVCYFIL